MILGFAQFGKQSRKFKKHLQKTGSKKQWTKHEQSLKKGAEMEPKTMKKPSKKRYEIEVPKSTRKVMKNTEKGSKMKPKRDPKGIKNNAENGTWKRSKFLEKNLAARSDFETY